MSMRKHSRWGRDLVKGNDCGLPGEIRIVVGRFIPDKGWLFRGWNGEEARVHPPIGRHT